MLTLLNCYDSSFWLTDTLSLDSMDLFSDMDGDKLVWFSCFFFRFSRITEWLREVESNIFIWGRGGVRATACVRGC